MGNPLSDKFASYTIHNDNEYHHLLESFEASGLKHVSDTNEVPTVIRSLENIVPGERYQIMASYLIWSQVEDKATEDETLSAVMNFLNEMFKLSVEVFPDRIMYKNKTPIMEWDKILICGNKVFLLETKHEMTKVCIKKLLPIMKLLYILVAWLTYKPCIQEHIENFIDRVNEFPKKLEITDSFAFKELLGKQYVGVVCGTLFTDELRSMSMDKGLIVVFPSGNRYKVEAPKGLMSTVKFCTYL